LSFVRPKTDLLISIISLDIGGKKSIELIYFEQPVPRPKSADLMRLFPTYGIIFFVVENYNEKVNQEVNLLLVHLNQIAKNNNNNSRMLRTVLKTPITSTLRYQGARQIRAAGVPFVRFYSEEAKKADDAAKAENAAKEELASETQEKDEVSTLKEEIEKSKKDLAVFKDKYLRSVADFQNLQESTKREIKKSKELALKSFAKDLLQTADTFDIALQTLEKDASETEKRTKEMTDLVEGVKLTQNMFNNTLKRHGLERFEPVGEAFDPNVHEAVFEVPQPDKEPGSVFFVQQPGYYLNQRVLRPAKVGVVKSTE